MFRECRLCLRDDIDNSFTKFYNYINLSVSIFDIYKLFTDIFFEDQNDRNNSRICPDCLQKMVDFYEYRTQARRNNALLIKKKRSENSAAFHSAFLSLADQLVVNSVVEANDFLCGVKQEILEDNTEEDNQMEILNQPAEFCSIEMRSPPVKRQKTSLLDQSQSSTNPESMEYFQLAFFNTLEKKKFLFGAAMKEALFQSGFTCLKTLLKLEDQDFEAIKKCVAPGSFVNPGEWRQLRRLGAEVDMNEREFQEEFKRQMAKKPKPVINIKDISEEDDTFLAPQEITEDIRLQAVARLSKYLLNNRDFVLNSVTIVNNKLKGNVRCLQCTQREKLISIGFTYHDNSVKIYTSNTVKHRTVHKINVLT